MRATKINEEMKLAAAHALAELTRQPVPTMVLRAYGVEKLEFGRTYLIPKPLDPRLLCTVAPPLRRPPSNRASPNNRSQTGTPMPRVCGNAIRNKQNPVE